MRARGNRIPPPGDPSGLTTGERRQPRRARPGHDHRGQTTRRAKANEPYAVQLADLVDQNRLGINFVWLLVTGFLVMFMQAGFALVETGFTRAKNAMHTMSMNFMVYALGMIGFFLSASRSRSAASGPSACGNLGGLAPLERRSSRSRSADTTWGIFGDEGLLPVRRRLRRRRHRVLPVPARVHGHDGDDPDRRDGRALDAVKPFVIYGLFISAILYPIYANWAWGGGWLTPARHELGLGARLRRTSPGSGVVHSIGGWCALAGAIVLGPRIGKYNKDGSANPILGHNQILALLGTFILAFGWFGFNPGSTFGASGNGALRIGIVAVVDDARVRLRRRHGDGLHLGRRTSKPEPGHDGQRHARGPGGDHGAIGLRRPARRGSSSALIAGVLVCLVGRVLRPASSIDDPVGAISVHGVNGLWGVLAVGIFADGTANYGGFQVTGLLYGNVGQFMAQVIGAAVAFVWAFGGAYIFFKVLDRFVKLRVSPEVELAGLDLPEMGIAGYIPDELPAMA